MVSTRDLIDTAIKTGASDDITIQLVELYVSEQRRRLERRCPLADIADGLRNVLDWAAWLVYGRWRAGP